MAGLLDWIIGALTAVEPPAPHRRSLRRAAPVGRRLSAAERREVILGQRRPKLPPRGMPAHGRLFKGHRP